MTELYERLLEYQKQGKIKSKGGLAAVLHVSRMVRERGLPLVPSELKTDSHGQVQGLGKGRIQNILKDYGITRVLAEEGGRTSRGSVKNVEDYAVFLNHLLAEGVISNEDYGTIESWWIDRVKDYFSAKPFTLKYDLSRSLQATVTDLLEQAFRRQQETPGTMYAGAVLQHLVGAKLELLQGEGVVKHNGFSVADSPNARHGDFLVGDSIIHVTTAPGEALLRKCQANLESGHRPIIVTLDEQQPAAKALAKQLNIEGRIEIWDAEQLIATNLYEMGAFNPDGRKVSTERLVEKYNEIVSQCETDPSLRIAVG